MKAITLHTPFTDNGGQRRDAGQTVPVGKAARDIAPESAKALVEASSAIVASPTAADQVAARPTAKKAD